MRFSPKRQNRMRAELKDGPRGAERWAFFTKHKNIFKSRGMEQDAFWQAAFDLAMTEFAPPKRVIDFSSRRDTRPAAFKEALEQSHDEDEDDDGEEFLQREGATVDDLMAIFHALDMRAGAIDRKTMTSGAYAWLTELKEGKAEDRAKFRIIIANMVVKRDIGKDALTLDLEQRNIEETLAKCREVFETIQKIEKETTAAPALS